MASTNDIEITGTAACEISEEARKGMKIVAEHGDTKFAHLCLYNSLYTTGNTQEGVDGLLTIYSNLMGLHG